MSPRFVRRDPETGLAVFDVDGQEMMVDDERSPFARDLIARSAPSAGRDPMRQPAVTRGGSDPGMRAPRVAEAMRGVFQRSSRTLTLPEDPVPADAGPPGGVQMYPFEVPMEEAPRVPQVGEVRMRELTHPRQPRMVPITDPIVIDDPAAAERAALEGRIVPPPPDPRRHMPTEDIDAMIAREDRFLQGMEGGPQYPVDMLPEELGGTPLPTASDIESRIAAQEAAIAGVHGAVPPRAAVPGRRGSAATPSPLAQTLSPAEQAGQVALPPPNLPPGASLEELASLMVPGGELSQYDLRGLAGGSPAQLQAERLANWQGENAIREADAVAGAAGQMADARQGHEEALRQIEQERQVAMARARGRYTRAIERVEAMHVDPAHFFSDGGRTVGAVIAVALGAAGTAVSGDPRHQETALNLINQAVERDISAQEENMSHQRALLPHEENLVGMMHQEFEDRVAAENAARAALYSSIAAQLEREVAEIGSDDARRQAQQLAIQVREQAAAAEAEAIRSQMQFESRMRLEAARAGRLEGQTALDMQRFQRRAGGGGGTPRLPPQILNAVMQGQIRGLDPMQSLTMLVGPEAAAQYAPMFSDVLAVTPAQAQSVRRAQSALRQMQEVVQAGVEQGDIAGAGPFDSTVGRYIPGETGERNRRAERAFRNALGTYQLAMTGLAATDAEREDIQARMMQLSRIFEGDVEGALQTMQADLEAAATGNIPPSLAPVLSRTGGRRLTGAEAGEVPDEAFEEDE